MVGLGAEFRAVLRSPGQDSGQRLRRSSGSDLGQRSGESTGQLTYPPDLLTSFYFLTKGGNSHKAFVDHLNTRTELKRTDSAQGKARQRSGQEPGQD